MTEHTPGPWTIEDQTQFPDSGYIMGGIGERPSYICITHPNVFLGSDDPVAESLANAHLIAAAPRMFELLVAIDERYNTDDRMGGIGDWIKDVLAEAREPYREV